MTDMIAKRELNRTGLDITEIGYGAASLGNLYKAISDAEAADALEKAWSSGVGYVDTAPYYGFGLSERRVGDVLRAYPPTEYIVSTKVGRLLAPQPTYFGNDERFGFCSPMPFKPVFDYSYDGVMRSYEASLQRLGLGKIEILFVHDIGVMTHGDENARHFSDLENGGYRALDELRGNGDISAIGLGVNECEVCEQAMEIGQFDCFLLAGRYSLLEQGALNRFFPKCEAHGARIIAGGVYNSGILATGVSGTTTPYYNYAPAPPDIVARVGRMETICGRHDVSMPAAALQFVLAHPLVVSVIPGMGSARRIDQVLAQYRADIPPDFWREMVDDGLIDPASPLPAAETRQ